MDTMERANAIFVNEGNELCWDLGIFSREISFHNMQFDFFKQMESTSILYKFSNAFARNS